MSEQCLRKLDYTIYEYSSFSEALVPENILADIPSSPSSRWSSDSSSLQFLVLKLDSPAIVKKIQFGKYEKNHVCNLKKFKIFGGMDEDPTLELLDHGLKYDTSPEMFCLRHKIEGKSFPCQYIKIVPIQCWGGSYSFSIWYVALYGLDEPEQVKEAIVWFHQYRLRESMRICLKHLRRFNCIEAFNALKVEMNIELEDQLLTRLHSMLVKDGDFISTEKLLRDSFQAGLFDEYMRKQPIKPIWKQIQFDYNVSKPCMRAGHQMCVDPHAEIIYLFGGWNGTKDLSDFWKFSISSVTWQRISDDTTAEGGPSARSTHRVCIDYKRKKLFILGRYVDRVNLLESTEESKELQNDFYVYDIETNAWQMITDDTFAMKGPHSIGGHKMCIDIQGNCIYVFGGRVNKRGSTQSEFSGFYKYHVPTNTWQDFTDKLVHYATNRLLETGKPPESVPDEETLLRPIIGSNSALWFHSVERALFIFTAFDADQNSFDLLKFHVDTNKITVTPTIGSHDIVDCTAKSAVDEELNEIYILSTLKKDLKPFDHIKKYFPLSNSLWVYDIVRNDWSSIFNNEPSEECDEPAHPCPRYGFTFVYDPTKRIFFLFGGNPQNAQSPTLRLDDLWQLNLSRIDREECFRQCIKTLRELNFREKIADNPIAAVQYLQTELSQTFNHSNVDEAIEFQQLASLLFTDNLSSSLSVGDPILNRSLVFDKLVKFFPESMTQPRDDLISLLRLLIFRLSIHHQ